jgi:hypothetical protein
VRSAGEHGGQGELAIVNAHDNTEEVGVVVTSEGRVRVETGKKRTALQKRLAKVEAKLSDAALADADSAGRARPFVRDERLRPVHAEIIRALRAADGSKVLAAARKVKGELSLLPRKGAATFGTFASLYASAPAVIDALERGDERVYSWCAGQYLAASLEILHAVSKEQGASLASRALAALKGRKDPSSLAFRDVAVGIDSASSSDGADAKAELTRLRREVPKAAVWEQPRIREHPIVTRLEKRRSEKTRAAILGQLARVLGSPEAWKTLTEKDASYGYALTHLLEKQKHPEDAGLLKALWRHPHWMIANPMKAPAR